MGLFSKSDDELIAQLNDRNEERRRKAVQQLKDRKSPQVAAALARAIRSETNGFIVSDLSLALFMIGDANAVGEGVVAILDLWGRLSERMARENEQNRSQVAYAMGTLGSPLVFHALAAAAEDPYETVRERAYLALGNLGLPWGFDVLRRGLDDVNDLGRRYAIEAIGLLSHPGAYQILQPFLGSADFNEHDEARKALQWFAAAVGVPDLSFLGQVERDLDTLGRLLHTKYSAYATNSGKRWFEHRKGFAQHLMTDECLAHFGEALGPVMNSYERLWAESVLSHLRTEAKQLGLQDRVEAIGRLGNA